MVGICALAAGSPLARWPVHDMYARTRARHSAQRRHCGVFPWWQIGTVLGGMRWLQSSRPIVKIEFFQSERARTRETLPTGEIVSLQRPCAGDQTIQKPVSRAAWTYQDPSRSLKDEFFESIRARARETPGWQFAPFVSECFASPCAASTNLALQAAFQSLTLSADNVRLKLLRVYGASARSSTLFSDEDISVSDDKPARFSRSGRTLPRDFGPNDHVAKIHMPAQLYTDLSALAVIEGKGLSEYLRDRLMEFAYGELEAVRLRTHRESRQ